MVGYITCAGCGARVRADVQSQHLASSRPACSAAYDAVLARSYQDIARRPVHQLLVDAWTVQHPQASSRVHDQSIALHLMTLCLFIDRDVDPLLGPRLHKEMMAGRPSFEHLPPPADRGQITVLAVLEAEGPDDHDRAAWNWARSAWSAWGEHHATVEQWVGRWQAARH
ncbi:DUF5946 family protein [Geodermatophilus sp. SYSU D00700]